MTNTIHVTPKTDLSPYMVGDKLVIRDLIATGEPDATTIYIAGHIEAHVHRDDLPTLVVQDAHSQSMTINDGVSKPQVYPKPSPIKRAADAVLDALKGRLD